MYNSFKVEISTPYKKYASMDAEVLTIEVLDGDEITLLSKHIDLIANLKIGKLTIKANGHTLFYAIDGGICNFVSKENTAYIMTPSIESVEEIDLDRAIKAKENAEKMLSQAKEQREISIAEIKLKRALNRIAIQSLK